MVQISSGCLQPAVVAEQKAVSRQVQGEKVAIGWQPQLLRNPKARHSSPVIGQVPSHSMRSPRWTVRQGSMHWHTPAVSTQSRPRGHTPLHVGAVPRAQGVPHTRTPRRRPEHGHVGAERAVRREGRVVELERRGQRYGEAEPVRTEVVDDVDAFVAQPRRDLLGRKPPDGDLGAARERARRDVERQPAVERGCLPPAGPDGGRDGKPRTSTRPAPDAMTTPTRRDRTGTRRTSRCS
jgi:hypothetical protein